MANFSSIEREMIEDAFNMRGGHVLDFTNRTFSEFIEEHLGFDPYAEPQYANLSKAKILRAILKDESDSFSGKIILALIQYREFKEISNSGDKYINKLLELGKIKMGKLHNSPSSSNISKETPVTKFNSKKLLADLLAIQFYWKQSTKVLLLLKMILYYFLIKLPLNRNLHVECLFVNLKFPQIL